MKHADGETDRHDPFIMRLFRACYARNAYKVGTHVQL